MCPQRLREHGISIGELPPGPLNAVTDVEGVRVGHTSVVRGDGPLVPGVGPVRTGVTVILPHAGNVFRQKVPAAVHTINGFGKPIGFEQVRELGNIESPIALTNTLNVGLVADALVEHSIAECPEIGISTTSVNVIVGETNDGYLNDLQGRHVHAEHVRAAIRSASGGVVTEGAVGAGAGTSCFGWKGGIGTASRLLPADLRGYTVGALVQSNFGRPQDLVVAGVPIGRYFRPPAQADDMTSATQDKGSIMIVLAVDAPLSARQLHRLCVRAGAGLARTGSSYGHGSGDFVIAFSTANRIAHRASGGATALTEVCADNVIDGLFHAVVESVEEAVLNSLFAASTTVGRDGRVRHALPAAKVAALVKNSVSRGERP